MKKKYIDPLLGTYLAMTNPDAPNNPGQKYFLTESGKSLLEAREVGEKNPLLAGW